MNGWIGHLTEKFRKMLKESTYSSQPNLSTSSREADPGMENILGL